MGITGRIKDRCWTKCWIQATH